MHMKIVHANRNQSISGKKSQFNFGWKRFPKKWNSLKKKGFCAIGILEHGGDVTDTQTKKNGVKMRIHKHLQVNPTYLFTGTGYI